jgi:hypothetical protein
VYEPATAPQATFSATVGEPVTFLADDFETDQGWTVENTDLETGAWERGVPVGGGARGDPETDLDGSGQCYLTENAAGNSDVDGGPTRLISPAFDVSGATDPFIEYARWFTNDDEDEDRLDVEISNDGGASWTLIESVPDTEGWVQRKIYISQYLTPTSQVRVRFSAVDNPNNSITEAAIDAVWLKDVFCGQAVCTMRGDMDGDNLVNGDDIAAFVACYLDGEPDTAECVCADIDESGTFGVNDVSQLVTCLLEAGCP